MVLAPPPPPVFIAGPSTSHPNTPTPPVCRAALPRERRVFVEAYVVLEEFVKEITTLLDVRCRILGHISRWAGAVSEGAAGAGAGSGVASADDGFMAGEDADIAVTEAYFQELLEGKHEPPPEAPGEGGEGGDAGPPPVPPPKAMRSLF